MKTKMAGWLKKFWQRYKFLLCGYFVYVVLSLNEDEILSLFGPLHCSLENPQHWQEFLVTLLLILIMDYVMRWAEPIDWFGNKKRN